MSIAVSVRSILFEMYTSLDVDMPTVLNEYLDKDKDKFVAVPRQLMPTRKPSRDDEGVALISSTLGYMRIGDSGTVEDAAQNQVRLDYAFALYVRSRDPDLFERCYARSNGFYRFADGASQPIASYGEGYCYLRMLVVKMRPRAARVLGKAPYVGDVLLLYILSGYVGGNSLAIRKKSEDFYHVVNTRRKSSFVALAQELLLIFIDNPYARIGMDDSMAEETGDSEFFSVPELENLFGHEVERIHLTEQWLLAVVPSVTFSRRDVLHVLALTTSSLFLEEENKEKYKRAKRFWAICGDSVMKIIACMRVFQSGGEPGDYSALVQLQSKTLISGKFVSSGMRIIAEKLETSGNRNADTVMFQAFVGFLYHVYGIAAATQFLEYNALV